MYWNAVTRYEKQTANFCDWLVDLFGDKYWAALSPLNSWRFTTESDLGVSAVSCPFVVSNEARSKGAVWAELWTVCLPFPFLLFAQILCWKPPWKISFALDQTFSAKTTSSTLLWTLIAVVGEQKLLFIQETFSGLWGGSSQKKLHCNAVAVLSHASLMCKSFSPSLLRIISKLKSSVAENHANVGAQKRRF